MAFRGSITARAKFFYQQQQRVAPSFSLINRNDSDREELHTGPELRSYTQQRLFGTGNNFSNFHKSVNVFQDRKFAIPAACGLVLGRNYSSESVGEGAADNIEILNDMAGVVADRAADVAPVLNEVAIAAADSYFPVAALQYLIGYVHCYTGLNWWASIAVTALLIRWIQIPLVIYQIKAFTMIVPRLQEVLDVMQEKVKDPTAAVDGVYTKLRAIMNEHGVLMATPYLGILISAPIFWSFFFAINTMVEKVPSFKEGGTLWFTDLTTPDSLYIFPVLTALTFCVMVEERFLQWNPNVGTTRTVIRVFAGSAIPLIATFPKAVFCHWITSILFSMAFAFVMRKPEVQKYLGIVKPSFPSTNQKKPTEVRGTKKGKKM